MTKLDVKRGDTIDLVVGPVRDSLNVVQDLTGSSLRFTAKDRLDDLDNAAIVAGSTSDGRITIPAQSGDLRGCAVVRIPATVTAGFTDDRVLHWDVQITQPDGRTKTLDDGILIVRRDVTQATS